MTPCDACAGATCIAKVVMDGLKMPKHKILTEELTELTDFYAENRKEMEKI